MASLTLHSALTDFKFIVVAPPVIPKKSQKAPAKGKRRVVMLHSDSDEDSEEEQKNRVHVNRDGLYLEHGFYT